MADEYLAIAAVASDQWMLERMRACATQQEHLGAVTFDTNPSIWVDQNRYVWASSPGWGEKWQSALASHPDDPDYEPGKDMAVITDSDILTTVQALGNESKK
jgi:hypothetical protein